MKIQPRPALGFAAYIAYACTVLVLGLISGVDYGEISDSAHNILVAIIVPVGAAGLVMVAFTSRLGWWREVFVEERARPNWLLLIPALIAAGILAGLAGAPYGSWPTGTLLLLLIGTILVGFGEEIVTRGLLLVGLRARFREVWVWLLTSGLFALTHALNFLYGQALGRTLGQIAFAFLIGSVLYACRRVTGLLVVPMALHALWDFSLFVNRGPAGGASQEVAHSVVGQGLGLLRAAAITLFVLRRLVRNNRQPAAA